MKSFSEFLKELQSDAGFLEEVRKAKDDEQVVELVTRLAKNRGISFSQDEVSAALRKPQELSERELSGVSGGMVFRVNVDRDQAEVVRPPNTCSYRLRSGSGGCSI